MPTLTCPLDGYEDFTVTFPDEFLVLHHELYAEAVNKAVEEYGDQVSVNFARFYGCKALCSQFDNAPVSDIKEWPLGPYMWFLNTVYYDRLDKALNPPKN